jgi:hypothetical protein
MVSVDTVMHQNRKQCLIWHQSLVHKSYLINGDDLFVTFPPFKTVLSIQSPLFHKETLNRGFTITAMLLRLFVTFNGMNVVLPAQCILPYVIYKIFR